MSWFYFSSTSSVIGVCSHMMSDNSPSQVSAAGSDKVRIGTPHPPPFADGRLLEGYNAIRESAIYPSIGDIVECGP
jgi:hypothetical protein